LQLPPDMWYFEDPQDCRRPCAVVYTNQDPNTKDVFDAIKNSKGEANVIILGQIRDFVISKHSNNGRILTWRDVSDRIIEVVSEPGPFRGGQNASVSLSIAPAESGISDDWPDVNAPSAHNHNYGRDVLTLPDEYFSISSSDRRYIISVCIDARGVRA
jgi:hypothetical protein